MRVKEFRLKKAIGYLMIAILVITTLFIGQFIPPLTVHAANVNGPTVIGVDTSIGAGNTCTIMVKGTYEILGSTGNGTNGAYASAQGGLYGVGQQVRFTVNLDVGDVLTIQQISGGAGAAGTKERKGTYTAIGGTGGNGGPGITILHNDTFLLSLQGGSGGGGGGSHVPSGANATGGTGGTGGYTNDGTCITNPSGGGAGGHGSSPGSPGGNGTGLYINQDLITTHNLVNSLHYGGWGCVLTLRDIYVNNINSFQPVTLSVKYGTTYEQILAKLPLEMQAVCTQGLYSIPVTWSCDYFDPSMPGAYIFTGTLGELPDDVQNPTSLSPSVSVTLVNVGPEQTFDAIKQLIIPTINVVKGQEITRWLSTYDDMDSVTQGTIQIINEDKTDQVIQLIATINTAGSQKVVINGYTFIFNVIEEPDSSNVDVTFN